MEYHTMLGDISEFQDKDFFESHCNGKADGRSAGKDKNSLCLNLLKFLAGK